MSFASKVLYTGDGVIKQFNIPFSFLSSAHVNVYVNNTLQLNPMHYTLSGSTVTFSEAPGDDAAIVIRRNTSPTATLVDFVDGSTLRAAELDTAYLHNFYLLQEATDGFNELLNEALLKIAGDAGVIETETDAVIAALVQEMLGDAAAATLQQRVNDIDANGEAIVQLGTDLQVQINTLAEGTAAIVYVQADEPVPGVGGIPDPIPDGARWYDSDDNNKPYIYDQTAVEWISVVDPRIGQAVADIDILQTEVDDNAAAIITEQLARSTADSALASELALLGAQNGGATAFILDTSTVKIDSDAGDTFATRFTQLAAADADNAAAITTIQTVDLANLQAKYGVSLNVNGHVTGFVQNNDGSTGSFVIVADKFAVVDPTDSGTLYTPLQYSGGVLSLQNVEINGTLLINGSVPGVAIAAGGIGTTQIGANAITTTQLNASAVTAAKIAANAVTADKVSVTNLAAINADLGAITAGSMTLNSAGFIRGGQTDYHTGTGFFLGYSAGYKLSLGNPSSGNYLTWDGSTLTIKGDLFVGEYVASDIVLMSANTEQTSALTSFVEKKRFTSDRGGTVRIKFEVKRSGTGDDLHQYRIKRNSTVLTTADINSTSYVAVSYDVSGLTADDTISIEIQGSTGSPGTRTSFIRNADFCADVILPANGGSVDVD